MSETPLDTLHLRYAAARKGEATSGSPSSTPPAS